MVAYAGLRVAKNARGTYAKLLAAGVTSLFLSQAMLNVFTVLGLAPLTGVPLPFISYGSTNLIVLLMGMGVLLNVAAGGNVKLRAVARCGRVQERMAPTILIAAGGTAGHVVPALAVADALRAEAGADVVFVGGERAEKTLVPEAGYELRPIAVEGLSRTNPLKAARGVLKAATAVRTAQKIIRDVRPDAVMGGGGYVAGPVGAAAAAGRIPLVLTEADSHLGLTNRLLARPRPARLPGVPDRGPRRPGQVPRDGPTRPAGGGRPRRGAGARSASAWGTRASWSSAARSARARSTRRRSTRSATRRSACCTPRARATTRRCASGSARRRPANYDLREYITPFGDALAAADLTVARAGGSIFEVAAAGLPAVLVPYPHAAADHQTANARWMVDAGAAVVIRDDDVTAQRLDEVVGGAAPGQRAARRDGGGLARPGPAGRGARHRPRGAGGRGCRTAARPWAGRRVHLVGIGGAGMSGWARVAVQLGATVSGWTAPTRRRSTSCARSASPSTSATTRPTSPTAPTSSSRPRSRPTTPSASRAPSRAPSCCAS